MSTTVTYKGSTLTTAENQTRVLKTSGKYLEDDVTIVDVTSAAPVLQTKSVTYTPSESQQTDTVEADVGYDGLEEVDITINAIPYPDGDLMEFGFAGLTGTSWTFNSSIDFSSVSGRDANFQFDFSSNGNNYDGISIASPFGIAYLYDNSSTTVYLMSWTNQAYRDITITGGTDATNADLIAFIEANATQTS